MIIMVKKKDTKTQIMDGQKILGFIFDEFSKEKNGWRTMVLLEYKLI